MSGSWKSPRSCADSRGCRLASISSWTSIPVPQRGQHRANQSEHDSDTGRFLIKPEFEGSIANRTHKSDLLEGFTTPVKQRNELDQIDTWISHLQQPQRA